VRKAGPRPRGRLGGRSDRDRVPEKKRKRASLADDKLGKGGGKVSAKTRRGSVIIAGDAAEQNAGERFLMMGKLRGVIGN